MKNSKRVLTIGCSMLMMAQLLAGCGNTETAPMPASEPAAVYTESPAVEYAPSSATSGASVSRDTYEAAEAAPEAATNYAPREGLTASVTEAEACIPDWYGRYVDPGCFPYYEYNNESYQGYEESGYSLATLQPLSTFAADVDTASYANVRRMIEDGYGVGQINPDAVRAEEFLNYFSYDLAYPKRGEKFGVTTKLCDCPWNPDHQLLMVGMRTQEIDRGEAPDSNLVFLVDVSGSMAADDKLPLLQKSFCELTENLTKNDRVSIVTYSNHVEVVLDGARGDQKSEICDALNSLYASGGTNGEGGLQEAYALANRSFIKGGNNRILMATDGDLNIGISDPDELERYIKEKKDDGIFLSVLGFGTGNLKDDSLERLADYGNGNYSYIDSIFEARKVLVDEMGSTLVTVAKDVKLQVEFNPANVNSYRLIGYENRMMEDTSFTDDTKDGGEMGAGHSVVALYEIVPANSENAIDLKYQDGTAPKTGEYGDEIATVKIRYKEPESDTSKEVSYIADVNSYEKTPDADLTFASLVAEFAMILQGSDHKGTASLEGIMDGYQEYRKMVGVPDEYKEEFYYLVRLLAKQG